MKSLIDYYNDYAEEWAEKWYANDENLPLLKEFLSLLSMNPKVLDLCCGAGYESKRISELGANVVGVDLSEKSIEIAKQHNPNIEFYVQDMLISYKELGNFDGIVCIAGLVHIPEEKLELCFKNMHEVLNEKGYIFIVVKNGSEITKSVEIDGQKYAREFYCYSLEKLKEHAQKYFDFYKKLNCNPNWGYYIFKKK